jgi:hypothetical protein
LMIPIAAALQFGNHFLERVFVQTAEFDAARRRKWSGILLGSLRLNRLVVALGSLLPPPLSPG